MDIFWNHTIDKQTKTVVSSRRNQRDHNVSVCISSFDLVGYSVKSKVFYLFIKHVLDEIEHDIMNYQNQGLCYLLKPKADNTDRRFFYDIMQKPNSIIVLLYIFHIIHPQKHKGSVQPFCF